MIKTELIKVIPLKESTKGILSPFGWVIDVDVDDVEGQIRFGDIIIFDSHSSDCWEHVYPDWSSLNDTDFFDKEFDNIIIEGVTNSGIRINGYFIACYNDQSGCYSDNLQLRIYNKKLSTCESIEISNYLKDI